MPFLRSENRCGHCNSNRIFIKKVMIFRTHITQPRQTYPMFFYSPRKQTAKRVSRSASCMEEGGWIAKGEGKNRAEGSMTVEASLAVPIFLFFMVNVLSMLLFFHTFLSNLERLHQQGRQLSMMAYLAGDSGLIRDEMVQLVFPERIQPPVPVIGYPGTTIVSCCYMRAWTGYDVERRAGEDGEESYVYITDNGTAYHRSRACTHLTLSIMLVGKEEAVGMRNASGGKYSPCEKCGGEGSGIVYVTKEGDRYHSTKECSGLKRSVRCIPLSEAGGRTPCSRCAGG